MPTAIHSRMTQDVISWLMDKRVAEALEAYDAARNPKTKTKIEGEQQDDNVEANGNNGNDNGNGNENPNMNNRGVLPVTRECTYQDIVKCQPLNFKGTEGVVGLTHWFEKIETVFHISNCPQKYQGNDLTVYTQRFQELILLCTKMIPEEEDRVKRFIEVITIGLNLPKQILNAQAEARKEEIYIIEDLHDSLHTFGGLFIKHKTKTLEFQVGDKVMLKVSPWKGVIRFGKWGKLNPHYIGPFKIIAKVGTLAYRLKLLEKLSRVHSTFHVSNLKKCISDETLTIPLDGIQIDEKLYFIEEPVEIIDCEVRHLKQSRILTVKVRWNS
uniref:Putative reverse transcriptase domain-containing protein n=1 Tax=Tanacetum cinerariifolium TaxID=118510 RepID=A0A6L2M4P6_TANCI|nr:putative reverse transcriptase domain-containing protein [Tanacetum cinerariifolium]